ncbi:hypothetical protein [Microbacterium xylanilyticum]
MSLYALAVEASTARRRIRRVLRWVLRHPVRVFAFIVGSWLLISLLGGNAIIANAADGDLKSLPYLSALTAKDSGGVDMLHYVFLPIDRGDIFHPDQWFMSKVVDPIWIWNIVSLSWGLWFIEFLVTMEWVDWITPPLQSIFDLLSSIVTSIGWVPLAMAAAGLIGIVAIMRGRVALGITEIVLSLTAAALVAGMLANPIGMVTGPDGGIRKAQQWSGSVAAAIASDNSDYLNAPPTADNAKQVVNDALLSQVMDVWVRVPMQEVTFGHVLTGSCVDAFNTSMMQVNPGDPGTTSKVRDAIRGCDPAAADYASNPNWGTAATAGIATYGTNILLAMAVALGFVLLLATGYTIWNAGKWFFANVAAILPSIARHAWFSAMAGVVVGLFTIGMSIILVTAFLKLTTGAMTLMSNIPGLSAIAQLGFLDFMVTAMIITLVWQFFKAKKAGEKFAARMARLGLGRAHEAKARPVVKNVVRQTTRFAESYLRGKMFADAAGAAVGGVAPVITTGGTMGGFFGTSRPGAPVSTQAPVPMMPLEAIPAPSALEAGKSSSVKEKAAKALTAGVSVGLAAATGGTSAAVLALTKEGGKYVLQRGIQSAAAGSAAAEPSPTPGRRSSEPSAPAASGSGGVQRPTFTGFGRRIEVDKDGVSRVMPREAPQRGGVYRITAPSAPAPASSSSTLLRERLRKVAERNI